MPWETRAGREPEVQQALLLERAEATLGAQPETAQEAMQRGERRGEALPASQKRAARVAQALPATQEPREPEATLVKTRATQASEAQLDKTRATRGSWPMQVQVLVPRIRPPASSICC
jgi:hypothetical protein